MKLMNKLKFGFLTALFAATAMAANIGDDSVKIGKPGSSANKTIRMGAGRVVWNQSTSKLTFSNDAGGSFKNFGSGGGGGGGINLLTDFNFDFEGGTTGWTASGGSFTTANSAFGALAGVFNASATSQTVSSTAITLPEGFKSNNGAAGCFFKTTATDYKLQVFDGTNVLSERTIPVLAVPTKISTTFVFPSSGTIRLRVISASDAADLTIDECFLGENNLIAISQAEFVGSASTVGVALCSWNTGNTGNVFTSFPADTDCGAPTLRGKALAPTTLIPGVRFASLAPGKYKVLVRAIMTPETFSVSNTGYYRVFDGTTALDGRAVVYSNGTTSVAENTLIGEIEYTTSQTNVTFQVQGASSSDSNDPVIENVDPNQSFVISVYKYPTETESAFKPDQVANSWSGNHGADCSWTTTSTSLTNPSADATCTFSSVGNVNFGTVVSYNDGTPGQNLPGFTFTPSRVGTYHVCAMPQLSHNTNNEQVEVQLEDVAGPTKIASAWFREPTGDNSASATVAACGTYKATNTNPVTIRMRMRSSTGGGTAGISASGQSDAIGWSIFQVDTALPAPLLVNSVVSPLAGVMNVVSFIFAGNSSGSVACSSDPCTIVRQSGGVTAVNWAATGAYSATFAAGTFSAAPVCAAMANNTAAPSTSVSQNGLPTTTLLNLYVTNGTTATNDGANVICMGPK